jgi:triacylglycerol esterase/lipase EstA (alpha/beta hydrolase family)
MAAKFAAIWQRGGPGFQARHNLTPDQYQQAFDELTGQGLRPVCVSAYTDNGANRFAAIWDTEPSTGFQARHGLTPTEYQQTFDQLAGQGFRLTRVSGYEVDGHEQYAAIWHKDGGPAFQARHGLDADQYQQAFDELTGQGFRLTWVDGYEVGGRAKYAGIWSSGEGPAFQARHGLDGDQYQQAFDELTGQGFRLTCVSGYSDDGEDRYAAIWAKDDGPAFAARHGLDATRYQQAFDQLVGEGLGLVCVSGFESHG